MQSHFRRAQSKRSLLAGTTKSDETTWEVTQVAESQGASEGPLAAPCLPSVPVSGTACSQAPQAAGLCPYSLQPQPPPPHLQPVPILFLPHPSRHLPGAGFSLPPLCSCSIPPLTETSLVPHYNCISLSGSLFPILYTPWTWGISVLFTLISGPPR